MARKTVAASASAASAASASVASVASAASAASAAVFVTIAVAAVAVTVAVCIAFARAPRPPLASRLGRLEPYREPFLEGVAGGGAPCLALRAHRPDPQALYALGRARAELSGSRVVLLFDDTRRTWDPRDWGGVASLVTTDDALRRDVNPRHVGCYRNVDSQVVALARSGMLGDSEHLWLLEYDVYCDGDLARTLRKADALDLDFAATHVERHGPGNARWEHWGALEYATRERERVKSFFPVVRLSRRAIAALDAAARAGRTGYCEVHVPTAVSMAGGTCGNLPESMFGAFECVETCSSDRPPRRGDDRLHHKMRWGASPPTAPLRTHSKGYRPL